MTKNLVEMTVEIMANNPNSIRKDDIALDIEKRIRAIYGALKECYNDMTGIEEIDK